MARATINQVEADRFCRELAEAWYRTYSPEVTRVIREEAPIDTGLLRAMHSVDPPIRIAGGFMVRFRSEAPYTLPVHEGHGVIRPVKAKALRFMTKSGVLVFTQRVGPVAANPWLLRAFRRVGARKVRRVT